MDPAESTYGSDRDGLVWAFRFSPDGGPTPIDLEYALTWLGSPGPASNGSFVWLHFSLSNTGSIPWLRRHLTLPDGFYQTIDERASATRLEQEENTLVAVVHDALFDFTLDPDSISTVNLCLTPRLMLTARLRPVRSVDRLRAAVRAGETFRSTTDLLGNLLRRQAEVLSEIVRKSTAQADLVEDRLLASRATASRRELGALRRTHVRLQRLLAPEPASLFRLLSRPPEWIGAGDVQDLRQAAEEFSAAIADSAALVERVKLLQEELVAQVSENTNRTLFLLTVVTVMALPINLIAALLGMNVGGIPLSAHPHGFALVVGGLAMLTLVATYLAFGRRRE